MSIRPYSFTAISHLTNALHNHMLRYGYQAVEMPVIEPADLFLIRAGDQIVNKLFTFDRYGQQLALRPEFTAAAAHYYAQTESNKVARWQFYGSVFEDNPENHNHNYQRLSMGAELIGLAGPAADAEIIGMAVQGVQGLADWSLLIGHVGLMRRLLARFNLDSRTERFLMNNISAIKDPDKGKTHVLDQFDRMLMPKNGTREQLLTLPDPHNQADIHTESNTYQMLDVLLDATQRGLTMGGRTRHDIARRLLQKRQRLNERGQVVAALDFLEQWSQLTLSPVEAVRELQTFIPDDDSLALHLLEDLRQTLEILKVHELPDSQITVQPALARNWHYYTGIVFDIFSTNGSRLGGGGRYDELVSLVSNQENIPAVGFAYYLDEVLNNMQSTSAAVKHPVQIILTADNQLAASQLANHLRKEKLPVALVPESQATPDSPQVFINSSGEIVFHKTSYQQDMIDQLIADVKRAYNDQPNHNRITK